MFSSVFVSLWIMFCLCVFIAHSWISDYRDGDWFLFWMPLMIGVMWWLFLPLALPVLFSFSLWWRSFLNILHVYLILTCYLILLWSEDTSQFIFWPCVLLLLTYWDLDTENCCHTVWHSSFSLSLESLVRLTVVSSVSCQQLGLLITTVSVFISSCSSHIQCILVIILMACFHHTIRAFSNISKSCGSDSRAGCFTAEW